MIQFMKNGGVPMWFILAFGVTTLVSAIAFARRPEAHRIRFVLAMGLATVLASINGLVAALAMVCVFVADDAELSHGPDLPQVLLRGLGESLANPILGFTLLTLASFVLAMGIRRLPRVAA